MKEERNFLFHQKVNDGESPYDATKEIKADRAYLKELKLKNKKKKPKLNFKLCFEETKKNGN